MPSNGLDAMFNQRDAAKRQSREIPKPLHARESPTAPSADAVGEGERVDIGAEVRAADLADEEKQSSTRAARQTAGRAKTTAIELPPAPVVMDRQAAKAAADAALAWASSARKLVQREGELVRALTAARAAGVPRELLQASVMEAQQRAAGVELDRAALAQVLK